MTIHLLGGKAMIKAASQSAKKEAEILGITPPKIVGVTVLTSLGQDDLVDVGIGKALKDEVISLAKLASECGLDGIVCSPADLESVRPNIPKDFLVITPGIRPVGAAKGDQERIATPRGAIDAGADLLVIGRPIKDAPDPIEAARKIAEEMA
jgi:orotidine-5'-phosphate decarboxylase